MASSLAKTNARIVTIPAFVDFEKRLKGGYKVKIAPGTKRITLYRNLLAKCCFDPEGIRIEELLTIYHLAQELQEKLEKDPEFKQKFELWLITTFEFVKILGSAREFPAVLKGSLVKDWEERLKPYLPSREAYFGWKNNPIKRLNVKVLLRNSLEPPKNLSQRKRTMGVGYRDKGHKRDLAYDGSPHWTEIASAGGQQRMQSLKDIENKSESRAKKLLKILDELDK
jgi:hypothetical protein